MMFFNCFFLCLLCVVVSLLSFVVWFATIEKAEVPPPAGKGMNHKWGRGAVSAPKKSRSKNRGAPFEVLPLNTLSLIPAPIFEIPFHKLSLDFVLPTVHKTLIIFSFIRGAQPSAIWCRNNTNLIIIVATFHLNVFRRVA